MRVDVERACGAAAPSVALPTRSSTRPAAASTTTSSSEPSSTAATICASVTPPEAGISRSMPAERPGTRSFDGTPVRDHEALEAPFVAQYLREQPRILRGIDPVDAVVRAHHGPGLCVLDDSLEAAQVDLAQRSRVDVVDEDRIRSVSWLFAAKCLQRRADAVGLDPLARGRRPAHRRRAIGSSERYSKLRPHSSRPLDVDTGTEQHRDVLDRRLGAERLADALHEIRCPTTTPRPTAGGKHVAGTLSPMPRWSPPSRCLRRPCGPSVIMIAGTPTRSIGLVYQKSRRW